MYFNNKRTKHIGIDLGTTFCSCSYFDLVTQKPSMIGIDQKLNIPSWINMCGLETKDKSCWIGNNAKDSKFCEYALVYTKGGSLVIVTENPVNGEEIELLPEQVHALLLKKVFATAKRLTGNNIGNVVIAVTTDFNDKQRQTTLKAAKISGIEVTSLINKHITALLAYENRFPDEFANVKYSVVFDFGGRILDITVCEKITNDRINVVNYFSDQNLGGNNFDKILIDIIKERILEECPECVKYFKEQQNETGKDKMQRKQVLAGIKNSKKVKIELSKKTMADIPLCDIPKKN